MTDKPIKYGKSLSLDALSNAIAGDEARYGPLKAIAAGESTNYAIFDRRKAPSIPVELVIGQQEPDGYNKISASKMFILGALLDVVAVRKLDT